MEVVLEPLVQDTPESTTEVRKEPSGHRTVQSVEETEEVSVQVLMTEVLEKDPILGQALNTSRLMIQQYQHLKPQTPIPVDPAPNPPHDRDDAAHSLPNRQMTSPEDGAVEPSSPPQSRMPTSAPVDVESVPQAQTLFADSLESCSQMPSDPEPSPELQPPVACVAETLQSQPEQCELPKRILSSSESSLATSDDSPPPSTPTTSDPYDTTHFYIRSMSPDDDDDLSPEVFSKILDIPTLPLPETDDDDDFLLSHCFDYPDLDVAG